MNDPARPDPDALLARAQLEDLAAGRGKLKIFLGAVAGVGKTYAMLEAAHERLAEGADVVVGYVDTHGRSETEALLTGLPVLPTRKVVHRGHTLAEFDLDAVLARKPGLVLVDELAHTNAPGSRHARRWQDVDELLRAGINVYTTLNVQHLESLVDLVAQITGVIVRETVPDSIVESANEVELIDLPPDDLLARLREGKVYVPEQATQALVNFFRKGNLIVLRELALRCTADRVDAQMQVYRRGEASDKTWPVAERILICISASPSAVQVVRAGRRLARRLRAEWMVVYVEQPRHVALPQQDRDYASLALRLTEQLGGEAVVLSGRDAVQEIVSYARRRNVSKIVVGKPGRFWWLRDLFARPFVDRLARRSGEIDVLVVHGERGGQPEAPPRAAGRPTIRWPAYAWAAGIVALCSAVNAVVYSHLDLSNLLMVYLLGVVVTAVRHGRGPSVVASVLSVAAFDVLFVPPRFSFKVEDSQYLLTFAVTLVVALVISGLTATIRRQVDLSRERERRTHALFSLSRELASQRKIELMLAAIRRHVEQVFDGRAAVFLPGASGLLEVREGAEHAFTANTDERGVAAWTHEHGKPAGWSTDTLRGADAIYLPLTGARGPVGILGLCVGRERAPLTTDQMHLLETFANQAALALERAVLAREAHHQRLAAEEEKLRNAVLAAVSHDLRTPLASISGAASSLAMSQDRLDAASRRELVLTIHEEAERMTRLATNLLDMGRLQARGVVLRREWQHLEEVFGAALNHLESLLKDREITLDVPDDLPQVPIDDVLIERVLVNLIDNAVRYTPAAAPIEVNAATAPGAVTVSVMDRGPGLAPGEEKRIFERFFGGEAPHTRHGAGLGLAVARVIVEAHGGRIWAENRAGGGASFRFTLPLLGEPPDSPEKLADGGSDL